jgi:hypothetical protein
VQVRVSETRGGETAARVNLSLGERKNPRTLDSDDRSAFQQEIRHPTIGEAATADDQPLVH